MGTSFFEHIGHSVCCRALAVLLLAVLVIRVADVVVGVIRRVVRGIRRLPQQEQEQQEPERQQLRLIRGLIGRALERLGEDTAWHFVLWVTSMDQYKYGRDSYLRAFFTTDDYAEFVSRFGLSREQAEAELERLRGLIEEMDASYPGSPFEGKRVWRVPSMVLETILERFPVQ